MLMGPVRAEIGSRVSKGGFFMMKYRIEPMPFPCLNRHIEDVEAWRLLLTSCIQQ